MEICPTENNFVGQIQKRALMAITLFDFLSCHNKSNVGNEKWLKNLRTSLLVLVWQVWPVHGIYVSIHSPGLAWHSFPLGLFEWGIMRFCVLQGFLSASIGHFMKWWCHAARSSWFHRIMTSWWTGGMMWWILGFYILNLNHRRFSLLCWWFFCSLSEVIGLFSGAFYMRSAKEPCTGEGTGSAMFGFSNG